LFSLLRTSSGLVERLQERLTENIRNSITGFKGHWEICEILLVIFRSIS
jgi:hypothetical protein